MEEKCKLDNYFSVMISDCKNRTIETYNPEKNNEKKQFTFDFTYSPESSQEQIFNETALPILTCLMQGYNGTIFAYGQTGTGKTFTMEGGEGDLKGIVPRTIDWIFGYIKKTTNIQYLVQVSFVEIYMEEVRDLLAKNTGTKLNIREKESGLFYIEDCKKIKVESPDEMHKLMLKGREMRKTGATLMNAGSSRSHSIFQIVVENSEVIDGETKYRMGKLNLVDLAGSERQGKTGATGERLKEGSKINLSLSILGNVISALVTGKDGSFIPYRESKLTMLLADSLGGNTKTVMIANVGPADYNYDESLNTLWYASRAKKIKNKPKINEDPKDALLRTYQEEIENLKKQLAGMNKGGMPMKQIKGNDGKMIMVEDNSALVKLEEQLEQEKENFRKKQEEEIQNIDKQKNLANEEREKLLRKLEKEKEDFKKNKEEANKMLKKYKELSSKVLNSDETNLKVKKQEEEIKRTKEEIQAIKLEEERLLRDLEQSSKKKLELQAKYTNIQQNVEDLNNKIQLIKDNIEQMKNENRECIEKAEQDKFDLQDYIKYLKIDILKNEFIIKHFIPESEKKKIIDCIEYNEEEDKYVINKKKAVKQNYLTNKEIFAKIRNNQMQQLNEGFMNFCNDSNEPETLLNLNFEMTEPFVADFTGEPNPNYHMEVSQIIKDDDSDLLYYDKELDLFDSNIDPIYETGLTKEMINKKMEKPKRLATGKKK